MSDYIPPDREQFLVRLNAAVDAYLARTKGRRPTGTKTWLAEQLGCDRTTLYKYLDGTNRIPLDALQALARLVGLDLNEVNTLLFLGGYGVAVPVTAPLPSAPGTIDPVGIREAMGEALRAALPGALDDALADRLSLLTGLLSDLCKGQLTRDDFVQILASDPTLSKLLRTLSGQRVMSRDTLIDLTNVQSGAISFGDVAGGNIVHITIQPPLQPSTLHQLRAPVTDFVGRQREVAELTAVLNSGAVAAISGLVGMGGIGKTELAIWVANALVERYPDAQIVLNLQGSRDLSLSAAQALQQVVRAFLPDAQLPNDEAGLAAIYRSVLSGKHVLILADDARDAAQVQLLLPPVGSALLITSRRHFSLPGMQRFYLETLAVEEAITLLRKVCTRLSEDEAKQIATACGRLPLALRIAGGVLSNDETVSVSRYLGRLADEAKKLAALSDPDDPELAVEASIALSYELLPLETQDILQKLGVFAADFSEHAAVAILDPQNAEALEEQLGLLYRRSLIEYSVDQGRCNLHELVRVFALKHLRKSGNSKEYNARIYNAMYYITLSGMAEELFTAGGDNVRVGLELFDKEQIHLDAARRWLQNNSGQPDIDELILKDVQVTTYIGEIRYFKTAERLRQLSFGLEAARRLGWRNAEMVSLGNLGVAYFHNGDTQMAIQLQEDSVKISEELGDLTGRMKALGNLGNVYGYLEEYNKAIDYHMESLNLAYQNSETKSELTSLVNIGGIFLKMDKPQRALEFFHQALAKAEKFGAYALEMGICINLGATYLELEDIEKAIEYTEKGLSVSQVMKDRRGETTSLRNLGHLYKGIGLFDRAIEYYQLLLDIQNEEGDALDRLETLATLGRLCFEQKNYKEGGVFFEQAINIAIKQQEIQLEARILDEIADAYTHQGEFAKALEYRLKQQSIAQKSGNEQFIAETNLLVGALFAKSGHIENALSFLLRSLTYYKTKNDYLASVISNTIQHLQTNLSDNLEDIPLTILGLSVQAIQLAVKQGDGAGVQSIIRALPKDIAQTVMRVLEKENIAEIRVPDPKEYLLKMKPLIEPMVAVARGNLSLRVNADTILLKLEASGMEIVDAIRRIWAGERDQAMLTANINNASALFIKGVLDELEKYPGHNQVNPRTIDNSPKIRSIQNEFTQKFEQALTSGEVSERTLLAVDLRERARWASITATYHGYEWLMLEEFLLSLSKRLEETQ